MSKPLSLKLIKWPSFAVVALIRFYQISLSPVLGGQCRFYPSCSEYSRQAYLKYGLIKGTYRSLWRLTRCNPLHPGGVDQP